MKSQFHLFSLRIICLKLVSCSIGILFSVTLVFAFTIILEISFASPVGGSSISWILYLPLSWPHLHFCVELTSRSPLRKASWKTLLKKTTLYMSEMSFFLYPNLTKYD